MSLGPKATSVKVDGTPDDFQIPLAYHGEAEPGGATRLVVSVPTDRLAEVHRALIGNLKGPFGLLYRQKIDRRAVAQGKTPNQGLPPTDRVALELEPERLFAALNDHAPLIYHDARHEFWVRGDQGAQVIMDDDAIVYCYPDDPSFRDILEALGVAERPEQNVSNRDYVKHWFLAEADGHEDGLIADLGLQAVPHRKG